jgi:hypothetical protein
MGLSRSKDLESQIRVITSKDRQCILLSHAANRLFPVISELARVSEAGTASAGCVGELIAVTFGIEGGNLESAPHRGLTINKPKCIIFLTLKVCYPFARHFTCRRPFCAVAPRRFTRQDHVRLSP